MYESPFTDLLDEVAHAVEAARILCEASSQGQHATEYDAHLAPRAAAAVLTLVGQRLRLIGRAVRGSVATAELAGHHNSIESSVHDADGSDIYLYPDGAKR